VAEAPPVSSEVDPLFDSPDADDPLDPLDPEALDAAGGRSPVDELLDELVPPDLDWRRIVRRYPIPALLVAGAAGYWLGRSKRGVGIAEAIAGAVALGVTRELVDVDLEDPFE
jgi:hypothetical protein